MAGAPLGNRNGAKEKPWLAALNRALARKTLESRKEYLDDLADKLLESCFGGNLAALQELGNRLDGKPAQAITVGGDSGNPIIQRIERVIVRANAKD
jgi:hypothetical protein